MDKKLIEKNYSNYDKIGAIYLHFSRDTDYWTILKYAYKMCLSNWLKTDSVICYGETSNGVPSLVIVLNTV